MIIKTTTTAATIRAAAPTNPRKWKKIDLRSPISGGGNWGGFATPHATRVYGFCLPSLDRARATAFRSRYTRSVSYTHLRAHETDSYLVCRLLLEKKKKKKFMRKM